MVMYSGWKKTNGQRELLSEPHGRKDEKEDPKKTQTEDIRKEIIIKHKEVVIIERNLVGKDKENRKQWKLRCEKQYYVI